MVLGHVCTVWVENWTTCPHSGKAQKLMGSLNRGEKWQFTAQCAAKQCSTHLQSFFLYYLVCVELFYFFWAHLVVKMGFYKQAHW
jgi:hypothetical protein